MFVIDFFGLSHFIIRFSEVCDLHLNSETSTPEKNNLFEMKKTRKKK